MNIVDALIILIILLAGLKGLRRGVIKQLVTTVGFIIVVVLAFYFKNPIAEFLSLNFPFFKFNGVVVASFNILLYQGIAFLILIGILGTILKILVGISGIIEKILKFTIILGIPSKILGFIVGILEGFIVVFLVLCILYQPQFNISAVNESALAKPILNVTPIVSNITNGMTEAINDSYDLIMDYNNKKINDNDLDLKTIDTMLKHKVISPEYIRKLMDSNKINLSGIESILNKYSR